MTQSVVDEGATNAFVLSSVGPVLSSAGRGDAGGRHLSHHPGAMGDVKGVFFLAARTGCATSNSCFEPLGVEGRQSRNIAQQQHNMPLQPECHVRCVLCRSSPRHQKPISRSCQR